MATLVLLQGGTATSYPLNGPETVLGRHPDCTIQLESNMVSRRHAQLVAEDGQHFLEDLGSGNGTFVNGKRIASRTALKDQDRIKLGPILFRFESDAPSDQARRSGVDVPLERSDTFQLDIASGEHDSATIMGALQNSGGFGMLDVQPEAKLRGVLEISRTLAGTVDTQSLLPKILETLFTIFPRADRGCILLRDEETGQLVPATQKHRRTDEDETVKLSRTILNRVLEEKSGILSADASSDLRFQASESISSLTIRSMMCVPLIDLNGEVMGIINLDTQNPLDQFKKDDLELLMAVAGQAALSYESTRLMISHLEKEKQDNEMRIAANVQRALLPHKLPDLPGYDFFASYEAAQAVGGDYYDAILLPNRHIGLAFGDVAGKGVPASLVMSRLSSAVQAIMQGELEIGDAVSRINNLMCVNAVEGRFVTFVLTVIDCETHEMSVVNAGHMSPLIRHTDGTVEEFNEETVGIPLGIVEDYPYHVEHRKLLPGETIVIYTDGVSEAMNPAGDLYTVERLHEFAAASPARANELGPAILEDVKRHAAGRPQNDDITLMCFGRHPQ